MAKASARPVGVTVVAILVFIQAAFEVLGGVLLLLAASAGTDVTAGEATAQPWVLATLGWVSLIFAVITIIVGIGLLIGNRFARWVVIVLQGLTAIMAIIATFQPGHQIWTEIVNVVVAVVVIALLWTDKAAAFFRRNPDQGAVA